MAFWTLATIFRSDPGRSGRRPPVGSGDDHHRHSVPRTPSATPGLVPGSLHQLGPRLRCRHSRVPVEAR